MALGNRRAARICAPIYQRSGSSEARVFGLYSFRDRLLAGCFRFPSPSRGVAFIKRWTSMISFSRPDYQFRSTYL